MTKPSAELHVSHEPNLVAALGLFSVLGCVILIASILVADFVVPNHDWMADTISDLGAGRYEFIVDIGIYAFSASLISIALLAAHVHVGGKRWSLGIVSFALIGLLVFLIGARNEYGDNDSDGVVIHIYLVYALGVLFTVAPLLMAKGAAKFSGRYKTIMIGLAVLWAVSAPVFFLLPDTIDGVYERYLGLIAITIVITFARLFTQQRAQRG